MTRYILTTFLVATSFILASCETDEDNSIASALQCLDDIGGSGTSAENDAEDCYDMVDGIDSADASYIRCVAIYNMRGLFTDSFVQAFQNLQNTDGNTNNTNLEMMEVVAFAGTDTQTGNTAPVDSEDVLEECADSGSNGHTMLAATTRIGTVIGEAFGSIDADTWGGSVDGTLDAAEKEDLGEAAQDAWDIYCDGTSTGENEFCESLDNAGAGDGLTAAQLGDALAQELDSAN